MEKKGIAWSATGWLILGLIFLVVILVIIASSSEGTNDLLRTIKDILRFGG